MDSWRNLAAIWIREPNTFSALLLVLVVTLLVVFAMLRNHFATNKVDAQSQTGTGSRSHVLAKDRPLGEWTPVKFAYPSVEPCLRPLSEIAPLKYRPFRGGTYHQTMGIRSMSWDDWIELDRDYERYHRIRKRRIQTRGDKAIRVLTDDHNPQVVRGGGPAAIELVHELAEYLSRRYPTTFRVTSRHSALGKQQRRTSTEESTTRPGQSPQEVDTDFCDWGWDGQPPIKCIHVVATGETHELPLHSKDGQRAPERALEIASLLVSEDLAIMIEGNDGVYYFQAGAILIPGFWRLEDKIGLPLHEIHTSGKVPYYREKLETSMARFFRRLAVDKPVVRNNYFLQVVPEKPVDEVDPEELAWGTSTHGDEDDETQRPLEPSCADVDIERVRVRGERQTLRRLGRTGAIVFTIRTYCEPVTALGADGRRLAEGLASWPGAVAAYKGASRQGGWYRAIGEYFGK